MRRVPVGQLRERIRDIVTVSADDSLHRAAELMATHGISDLIAVQPETGFPVGVVSALGLTAVAASQPALYEGAPDRRAALVGMAFVTKDLSDDELSGLLIKGWSKQVDYLACASR